MRARLLVVDRKTPRPDQDSGSASVFSYLQILTRAGFGVTFAPFDLLDDGRYTRALHELGITTLSSPEYPSMEAVFEAHGPRSDILLLYRAPVVSQIFDLVKRAAPAAKILFHPVDLHFLRMEREAKLSGSQGDAELAGAMRATELHLISHADATIVVSKYERELLRSLLPKAVVHQIPILREVPPGSGMDRPEIDLSHRRDALFIGSFEHRPNVDAVMWFCREVWPIVCSKGLAHRFIIAGSQIPDEVAALASDTIIVHGYAKDLAALFGACRMSVAPLRYGAGIKGKIVSSLSYGVPVVATSIAAEAMELRHGTDILIADAPDVMADQIVRLANDDDLWRTLSSNGYQAFHDRFSLAAGADRVVGVIERLLRPRSALWRWRMFWSGRR